MAQDTEKLLSMMPFAQAAGVELVSAKNKKVVGRLEWAVCAFLNLSEAPAPRRSVRARCMSTRTDSDLG